jgi:hypothetical protein
VKGLNKIDEKHPSASYLYQWIEKQKCVCLRKVTSMDIPRIRASTKESINPFFDKYEENLRKFQYRQELIVLFLFYFFNYYQYNYDESAICCKKEKKRSLISPISTKNVYVPPAAVVSGISICPCVAADGEHLPTAIICNESYDLTPLAYHRSTDFRFGSVCCVYAVGKCKRNC